MKNPTIEILIICSKSKALFNPMGSLIIKEEGLGFSHFSIAIIYENKAIISEAVWPRPRFIEIDQWMKSHHPVFVFRKELKNQVLMFEIMSWMASLCTKSWYSATQLLLIYIGKKFPSLSKWVGTVKLNHEYGLICSEYIVRFLNQFFDYQITKSEDSIGLREPFDALTSSWVLLDKDQMIQKLREHV